MSAHVFDLLEDINIMDFSWNLRKYQDGDEHGIVELLRIAFRKPYSMEEWRWRYKENPACSPIIWLAEHDSKIIGHYAIVPIKMKVGNTYITGSFARNAATHPKYREKGIFSSTVNRCYQDAAENNIPLTYGYANTNLGPTYKRYEWRGHICFMVNLIKVLNWEPFLSRYIPLNFLVNATAQTIGKIGRRGSANGGLEIERIDRFDERVDRFWEKISKQFRIIVKRDHAYLNWRYADCPKKEYAIYTAMKNNEIVGYCVLSEERHDNMKSGMIIDILGFEDHRDVVNHLIQRSLRCFKENDIDQVICMMSEEHPYKAIFIRAGFIASPRRKTALVTTINLRGSSIDEKAIYPQALILSQNYFLKKKSNWFMMSGDYA